MKAFAQLFAALDETNKTNRRLAALEHYFHNAEPADAAWAVYFLSGGKLKRLVKTGHLREWAAEAAGLPLWMVEESYDAVGDLAETVALLLPDGNATEDKPLHVWVQDQLLALRDFDEPEQRERLQQIWRRLDRTERFVVNKLMTGSLRIGVSQRLVTRALANVSGVPADVIAHRMMGQWDPTPAFYRSLISKDTDDAEISRPYPFFLAHPLEDTPDTLGDPAEWQVEWKWDGIRAQLVRRAGQSFIWSRGEELVTDRWPELVTTSHALPDGCVLDGEILAWQDDAPLSFGQLQRRIGRKTVGKKLLSEVPVVFMAYDLLEMDGDDIRELPLRTRRSMLERLLDKLPSDARIVPSPLVHADTWDGYTDRRHESRERLVEGFMLKRADAPYGVGRTRGAWWKWKIAPLTIDAVLINAQRGHGRRASLYTDYTFGVWRDGELIPVAKAYSGLTDAEIRKVDRFVRQNTLEKFGPVRAVKPELVFELAFEGIQRSTRHKSGVALRFPRMLRWRTDKRPEDADHIEQVQELLPG